MKPRSALVLDLRHVKSQYTARWEAAMAAYRTRIFNRAHPFDWLFFLYGDAHRTRIKPLASAISSLSVTAANCALAESDRTTCRQRRQ
jgi:hypothetical protein